MIGIISFFVLIVWICLAGWLTAVINKRITKRLPPGSELRPLIGIALFPLVLMLPVIDEAIGMWQFKRLCQENATVYIAPDAKGRTVYSAGMQDVAVPYTWILPIRMQRWRYVDATTGEIIVSYNQLYASPGWIFRTFFRGFAREPLLFKGFYQPPNILMGKTMFKELGINYIEPPKPKNGGSQ